MVIKLNYRNTQKQRSSGKGYSLVECIVAFGLATLIMTTMWMIFSTNARQGSKTSEKLDGLKGAISFVQRFENDLARLYLNFDHELTIFNTGEKKIEFYVYSESASDLTQHLIGLEKITYYLSNERHGIYRQVDDGKKKRLRGYYENWIIEKETGELPLVKYLITSVSPGFYKKPEDTRKAHERVVFQGSVPLQYIISSNLNPNWCKVPIYTSDE